MISRSQRAHRSAKSRRHAGTAVLELAFAAGIIVYWLWFMLDARGDLSATDGNEVYLAFESAFPAADACLAAACVGAAYGLLRRQRWGMVMTAAAGGAAVFLGVLDISFNVQNGLYATAGGAAAARALINAACIGFGLYGVAFAAISSSLNEGSPASA